jgi:hypothetical protein
VQKVSLNTKTTLPAAGTVCSYRIKQIDGQQLIVRFTDVQYTQIYLQTIEGQSPIGSSIVNSQEITQTGSYKFILTPKQTLVLSVIIKDRTLSKAAMEIYTVGHEQYGQFFLKMITIMFSSTFALYLFLVITQKCRIVNIRHDKEVAEYRHRKDLYKQFETEELFKQNQIQNVQVP